MRPSLRIAEGIGLAHDAGNLFGALCLYCDLLSVPGVLFEEYRHYAEDLRQLCSRSRDLIDRLLDPETTRFQRELASEPEVVRIPEVLEQCRGLLEKIARRAVHVSCGAGAAAPIAMRQETLERILVNLTKNAAEASGESSEITLRVTHLRPSGKNRSERVQLRVEDGGCGMSVATMKHLMREPATLPSGPRGIGFHVVRELVAGSGGRLHLKSRAGQGTVVEMTWRVALDSMVPEESRRGREPEEPLGQGADTGRSRCLV